MKKEGSAAAVSLGHPNLASGFDVDGSMDLSIDGDSGASAGMLLDFTFEVSGETESKRQKKPSTLFFIFLKVCICIY